MKNDDKISEEQINAFVDGELETEEMSCLFDEAERSAELDRRVCQQRKIKELVKNAYNDIPEPRQHLPGNRFQGSVLGFSLAASLLLMLGAVSGIIIWDNLNPARPQETHVAGSQYQVADESENYIVHVTSGEQAQMRLALEKVRTLISSAEPGQPRLVEVVANEQGLDLLRSDRTPFNKEISALAGEDVIFYACSKAIQRLEEQGIEVRLVPEANPRYSALDRVVIRMQDGWQYVKI